jgi:hypothetical protein
LAHFEKKTATTQQFVVDLQALCILDTQSLQIFFATLNDEGLDGFKLCKGFISTQNIKKFNLSIFKNNPPESEASREVANFN